MSKLNQIQNALREMGEGAFQKLADAYLHKKGYERLNPIGSVIGSDKTRTGTPDTLIALPNGKYAFAEHTSQKTGVYQKFKGDLENCFDESKTGIPISKIDEVILCHTSVLRTEEEESLAEICREKGVNLQPFGLGPISHDLYQKYPGLARDLLGIDVDTGQIVPSDEFIVAYGQGKLATPLDTTFRFREEELAAALNGLESGQLVIVSGSAGVGKTRLALECTNRFKGNHPGYEVQCILNRGVDLFEDLRVHFAEPRFYLILVDDANRLASRFESILRLLHDPVEGRRVKIIATVRDYDLSRIRETASPFGIDAEINLAPLKDEQIRKLAEEHFGIKNYRYLDRITEIAKGNPRLAMMAAKVASRENTILSITDASVLYDEYYRTIRRDIEGLGDAILLRVAGILTFFRVIDRTNGELMARIEAAFGLDVPTFWGAVEKLHDMELVDMYENDVVKISDQVLNNYLFYLCYFKERALDLSTLLTRFFPSFRHRLVDSLNPVVSIFHSPSVESELRRCVDAAWSAFQTAGEGSVLIELIDTFASLRETDTLLFVQSHIARMESEAAADVKLPCKADANIPSPSILSLLRSFKRSGPTTIEMALGLLLDYLNKRPAEFPKVIHLLAEEYGFTHTSHENGFVVQHLVLDTLWTRWEQGTNESFAKLFLAVSERYLSIDHHTSESRGSRELTIINFHLPSTTELHTLRRTIWQRLFRLYRQPAWLDAAFRILRTYGKPPGAPPDGLTVTADSLELLPFVEAELSPSRFRDGSFVVAYLDFLDDRGVGYDASIRARFSTPVVTLADMLLQDFTMRKWRTHDFMEYQRYCDNQLREYFAGHDRAAYRQFFEQCLEIRDDLDEDYGRQRISFAALRVLGLLRDGNATLFAEVVEDYIGQGDPLGLGFHFADDIMLRLVELHGTARVRQMLVNLGSQVNLRWRLAYLAALPLQDITAAHLHDLYEAYRNAPPVDLPRGMDFLLKYRGVDRGVVARVAEILLDRAEDDRNCGSALSTLFNPHSAVNESLELAFADEASLLGRCYIFNGEIEQHFDFDGKSLDKILRLDSGFLDAFIESQTTSFGARGYRDTAFRDYSFLWKCDDYQELMTRAVNRLYERDRAAAAYGYTLATEFFALRAEGTNNEMLVQRQDELLHRLVADRHADPQFMPFLFAIATCFAADRQRPLLAEFLRHNKELEAFRRLPLLPSGWSSNRSMVPALQKRVDHLESLLPLFKGVELLRQKLLVEQGIREIRADIEHSKRSDFLGD